MRALLAPCLIAVALLVGGCGLHPLYANGAKGAVAQTLADVQVGPIEGHSGWLVRNAIRDRLQPTNGGAAGNRFRLDVRLDDSIDAFAIRGDVDAATRERRTLRARYQLVDSATGEVLLDATATQDAGIDIVGSDYATISAETSALERLAAGIADQIVARIAVYATRAAR